MNQIPNLGYCTNVHAGADLAAVKRNLERFAVDIKKRFSPTVPMGIGMWFSNESARQLEQNDELEQLNEWLCEQDLVPFTFNGFPYGNFHEKVVKQNVYLPTWETHERLEYTLTLARLQSRLLPPGAVGTISTLPLAWPVGGVERYWDAADERTVVAAATNLQKCAEGFEEIEASTGRLIRLAIEPEPGCILDNKDAVVKFFEQYLLTQESAKNDRCKRFIGICHDVCHSAVMFESQADALQTYQQHDIHVNKVQISSAIEVDFDSLSFEDSITARNQLQQFGEDRYLHQTCVRQQDRVHFTNDLPLALERFPPEGTWRVHFHVPIYQRQFGWIGTTQLEIIHCLDTIKTTHPNCQHFEVETYAWSVLPEPYQATSLQTGIADELNWLRDSLTE